MHARVVVTIASGKCGKWCALLCFIGLANSSEVEANVFPFTPDLVQ